MKIKNFAPGITGTIAGLMSIALFAGLASAQTLAAPQSPSAQAPAASPHPVRLAGKVSSVASNSLVLATRQGDVTVNINAQTWIVVQKDGSPSQGSVGDIVTGKATLVEGMTTSDPKVVDARTIAQGAIANGARGNKGAPGRNAAAVIQHMAAGTITAINGSTITLKGEKVAEVIVQTTPDTVVLNNGFVNVSSLKVGDEVYVIGSPDRSVPGNTPPRTPGTRPQLPSSRTLNAWAIKVDNGTSKLRNGHVTAVNGNVLTVRTPERRNGITVNAGSTASFKTLTVTNGSVSLAPGALSDVKVGSNLVVEGTPSSDGKSLDAKAVIILPGQARQK
jgi:RNase P/RNase MRP subunit p29